MSIDELIENMTLPASRYVEKMQGIVKQTERLNMAIAACTTPPYLYDNGENFMPQQGYNMPTDREEKPAVVFAPLVVTRTRYRTKHAHNRARNLMKMQKQSRKSNRKG